jgi:RHS repeat-associated protein
MAYDAAGNLMSYASSTYTYDQENRLSSTAGMSYTYDANGERALKSNTSTGAAVKRYWSMGGNTLAEGDGSGNLTAEYIYFGGKRVARIDLPANTVHYYLSDHLGSTSLVASATGTVEEESDYYPFGTEVVVTSGVNELKFTGKRRDTESQLDYFGARYYSNAEGRFMTPDWAARPATVPYAVLVDPQSLNLYSYVRNRPVTSVDPDGHYVANDTPMADCNVCDGMTSIFGGGSNIQSSYTHLPYDTGTDSRPIIQQQSGKVPVIVGQRATKNWLTKIFSLGLAKHSYYIVMGDMVQVLGNPGSSHNQQVRINDSRNTRNIEGEHTIYLSPDQAQALDDRSQYFAQHTGSGLNPSDYAHPCPVCTGGQEGYNFLLHNSNSFVFNMVSGAGGGTPPSAPAFTPGYAKRPDDWYPNP